MLETTPIRITPEITAFSREIAPRDAPVYVNVMPGAEAAPGECFFNVLEQVDRVGGKAKYGWIIWEWVGVMLTAEFHAVWETEGSRLRDVTPQLDGEERILFLPDARKTYNFAPVPSIRWPLSQHHAVREFIELYARMTEVQFSTFRGPARKGVPPLDDARLTPTQLIELNRVAARMAALAPTIFQIHIAAVEARQV